MLYKLNITDTSEISNTESKQAEVNSLKSLSEIESESGESNTDLGVD